MQIQSTVVCAYCHTPQIDSHPICLGCGEDASNVVIENHLVLYQVVTGYVGGSYGCEWVENQNHDIFASHEEAENFIEGLRVNPNDPPPRIVRVLVRLPSKG